MKILELIDSLHSGGAERMCVNIANVLHANGHEVQVCMSRDAGPLEKAIAPGIKCHLLRKRSLTDIRAFTRFINILRSEKISVIHAHSSSVFWAVFAKVFTRDIKVIWHDHLGRRVKENRSNIFYRLISPGIDAIIAVNNDLVRWSGGKMKINRERIYQINNFPLLQCVPRLMNSECYTIVCLANILPVKDHPTLIRAIDILRKSGLPKPLKVIFAGAYRNDEYYIELVNLINELDLKSVIEIAGSVDDTATLLSKADIGVLSSKSEGFPVSLLEYGLAALPVVVTDVGQCSEVVDHGRLGRIVPTGDYKKLAEELLYLLLNKTVADSLGYELRMQVQKNYGPEAFLSKYNDLLNKISINA